MTSRAIDSERVRLAFDFRKREYPRCSGCAFSPGTEASLTSHTRLQSELCVITSTPFLCHSNLDENGKPRGSTERRLCSGFVEAMADPCRMGAFRTQTERERLLCRVLEFITKQIHDDAVDQETMDAFVAHVRAKFNLPSTRELTHG